MKVEHLLHVEIDENEKFGLKGLPQNWIILLEESGLTKSEILANS